MDMEIIETAPLERQVQINVAAERVDAECKRALDTLRKRVKVKGFRPGKVPHRELQRRYGKSVRRDALQKLIRETIAGALKDDDLKSVVYVSPPEVIEDAGAGGFTYRFHAEVRPQVEPKGYLGAQIVVPEAEVDEEKIDHEIEHMRMHHATIEPVEDRDIVAADDCVTVSFKPVSEGIPDGALEATDAFVDLTHHHIPLEGISEALTGLKVDETSTIDVTAGPDVLIGLNLESDKVSLEVTVHAIKKRVLPDLDDDFADIAAQVATLDELRSTIRKRLTDWAEAERKRTIRTRLEEILIEKADFELPKGYLQSRVEDELKHQTRSMQKAGATMEQLGASMTELRVSVEEHVERRVRLDFVLGAIAEREKIKVTDKALEQRIEELVSSAGQGGYQVRDLYQIPGNRTALRERLELDKTLDFLASKLTILSEEPADVTASEPE
jgi:trigger factor